MYGPPEREAQGRGLMKREKEGAADSSRTENSKRGGGCGGEKTRGEAREVIERTGGEMLAELEKMERWRGGMDDSGEWRN